MKNIRVTTGLCGSGKSTRNYNDLPNSKFTHFLYLVPSLDFAKEVASNLNDLNISTSIITSTESDSVIESILEYIRLNSNRTTKEVLIITHQAYEMMDVSKFKHGLPTNNHSIPYSLIFDEEFACDEEIVCTFDRDVKLDNIFNIDDNGKVTLKNESYSAPTHGGKNEPIRRIIQGLKTGRFDVYKFSEKKKSENEMYVTFYKVINENYFGPATDITITTALFDCTMLYHVMKDKFTFDIEELDSKNENHDSNKIKIKYAIDFDNTKHLRISDPTNYHKMVDLLIQQIPSNEKCLMLINKDFTHNFPSNFVKLPNNSLGRNEKEWFTVNNSLMIGAYNFSSEQASFRKNLFNMDDSDLYLARTFSSKYYQSIMRSSLRVNAEFKGGQIIVMDKRAAQALLTVFPNASIEKINHNIRFSIKKDKENISRSDSNKACAIRKCLKNGVYKNNPLDECLAKLETRQLINSALWGKVSANGLYKQEKI